VRTARLFRVFPYRKGARPDQRGHPLFSAAIQGAGRIDNPEHYRALHASDAPAGAVAEAFGNHGVWTAGLLEGPPDFPGSVRALATIESAKLDVLDLDDAHELARRSLRPSTVVTRDRAVTQSRALALFQERRWDGVRWWSYYDPRWGSCGLWRHSKVRVAEVVPLTPDHPALLEAASVLSRPWRQR